MAEGLEKKKMNQWIHSKNEDGLGKAPTNKTGQKSRQQCNDKGKTNLMLARTLYKSTSEGGTHFHPSFPGRLCYAIKELLKAISEKRHEGFVKR